MVATRLLKPICYNANDAEDANCGVATRLLKPICYNMNENLTRTFRLRLDF